MSFFSFLVRVFNWVLVFLVELVLFAAVLNINYIDFKRIERVLGMPRVSYTISISLLVLMCVTVIVIFQKVRSLRYQKNIKFEDSNGEVIISLTSLESCIEKMLEGESDVHAAKVYIFVDTTKKADIHCWARISVSERNDIPARSVSLRKMIKRRMSEILPTSEDIKLVAELKVVPSPNKKSPNKDNSGVEDLSKFHGSEYPVW